MIILIKIYKSLPIWKGKATLEHVVGQSSDGE